MLFLVVSPMSRDAPSDELRLGKAHKRSFQAAEAYGRGSRPPVACFLLSNTSPATFCCELHGITLENMCWGRVIVVFQADLCAITTCIDFLSAHRRKLDSQDRAER